MKEEWPYNLPIWRRSLRLSSPDGTVVADIPETTEVSMSNPTIGTLFLSTGFEIERCNPSFIWSDDSKYIAVPQYNRNWFWGTRKQRILVVDAAVGQAWRSRTLAWYVQPETFETEQLVVTLEPFRKRKREVTFSLPQILNSFERIEIPNKRLEPTPEGRGSG